jgi:glycosyltransferase involved in cell wall biosynthesis
VAARVEGLPEVVAHEQTGLLVEPENSSALADGVAKLLTSPGAAKEMGQAARRRAQQIFSWQRHVSAYDALYQKVVTDWRGKNSSTIDQRFA